MSEERASLLTNPPVDYGSVDPESQFGSKDPLDLFDRSVEIFKWARQGDNTSIPMRTDRTDSLPILLYALHLNERDTSRHASTAGRRSNTRERVRQDRKVIKTRSKLEIEVGKVLDEELDSLPTLNDEVQGEESRNLEGGDGRGEDISAEIGEVEDILWRVWNINGHLITVIDLVLPPYTSQPSPFLSHPLFIHSLSHTWTYGPELSEDDQDRKSRSARLKSTLLRYVTPKRAHLLNLFSYLFLLLLTLCLALDPGRWIHPWKQQRKHPGTTEGLYITWAYSTFFNSFPDLTRTVLLLPTVITPLLAYLDSSSAFSNLALSIFPLTLLLILPHSPSLVFASSDIIPLSTLLSHILSRGLRSAGLILPLSLLSFGIFAWSLNGDIFRGFYTSPLPSSIDFRTPSNIDPINVMGVTTEPREIGIAPFETRVSLFITFAFLLLLSIGLTTVRILTPGHSSPIGDKWEEEYGPIVSLKAREKWTKAIRDSIIHKEIIPPLNWLVDSIIPLDEVLFIYRFFPARWRSERIKRWMERVEIWRDTIWIFVMGPLCFPLYLLDKVFGHA